MRYLLTVLLIFIALPSWGDKTNFSNKPKASGKGMVCSCNDKRSSLCPSETKGTKGFLFGSEAVTLDFISFDAQNEFHQNFLLLKQ